MQAELRTFRVGVLNGGDPDLVGGDAAQNRSSGVGLQAKGLIIISFSYMNPRSGADAPFLEKFKQLAITFVDATYQIVASGMGIRQEKQSAPTPADWTLELTQVSMRASPARAESGKKLGFKVR